MEEKLRTIRESFVILQEEEERIKNKKEKNEDDLRDLDAIVALRKELVSVLNDVINEEYTKEEPVVQVSQTVEDKIARNKKRLEEIENLSKKQYPKLEGKDKTRKKEILENLGFVSTKGFDGREVFISRDLVGEYFDLVRETKPLVEEQNRKYFEKRRQEELETRKPSIQSDSTEEISVTPEITSFASIAPQEVPTIEIPLEEEINLTRAKIMTLLAERDKPNQGKKTTIRFEGQQYRIPKTRMGEFKTLNTQYNSLRKKLREQVSAQERVAHQNIIPLSSGNEIKPFMDGMASAANEKPEEQINLPSGEEQPTENFGASLNIHQEKEPASEEQSTIPEENQPFDIDGFVNEVLNKVNMQPVGDSTKQTEPSSKRPEESTDDDSDVIDLANNRNPRGEGTIFDWEEDGELGVRNDGEDKIIIDYGAGEIGGKPPKKTSGEETPEEETPEEEIPEEETPEEEIVEVKKPKMKEKFINWIKKYTQALKRTVAAVIMIGTIFLGVKGCAANDDKKAQEPIEPDTTTTEEDLGYEEASENERDFEVPKAPAKNPYLEETEEEMIGGVEGPESEQRLEPEISPDSDPQTNAQEEFAGDETYSESEQDILIGSLVSVKAGSNIYATARDAIIEENAYHPYWDSSIDRVVLGVSIDYNGQIIHILPNQENYNQTIINLLNDGGKIVDVLTTVDKEIQSSLENGQKIISSRINNVAEGFYPPYAIHQKDAEEKNQNNYNDGRGR